MGEGAARRRYIIISSSKQPPSCLQAAVAAGLLLAGAPRPVPHSQEGGGAHHYGRGHGGAGIKIVRGIRVKHGAEDADAGGGCSGRGRGPKGGGAEGRALCERRAGDLQWGVWGGGSAARCAKPMLRLNHSLE